MPSKGKRKNSLSLVRLGKSFGEQFSESSVTMLANGMVYSTLIAVVPCLAVIYTVLNVFGVLDPFVALIEDWVISTFGAETGNNLVGYLSSFTKNAMGTGIISILSFSLTFILLIDKLFTCVNKIFHANKKGNPVLRHIKYIGIIAVAILAIVLLVYTTVRFNSLSLEIRGIEALSYMQRLMHRLLPYAIVFGLMLLINLFVPNIQVRFKAAIVGSIVGSVGVSVLLFIFQFVVQRSVKYSVIYGSLATLMFFFLFLSYLWKIVFASVTLTYVFQSETSGVEYHI